MKKSFYFALALTAGLFASCSSDDLTADAPQQPGLEVDDAQPVPIQIGVSNVGTSVTRGSATVGTSEGGVSAFLGQEFQVFMFNKGTLIPASADGTNAVYCDSTFTTANLTQIQSADPDVHKNAGSASMFVNDAAFQAYYPTQGEFDFWAYRIDDAVRTGGVNGVTGFAAVGANADVADEVKVAFTIDGSQDIMLGTANTAAAATALNAADSKITTDAEAAAKIYSAYAARKGVNPSMSFKHMLTRLHFAVKPNSIKVSSSDNTYGAVGGANIPAADANGFTGFRVDSIAVYSKKTGNLIVAYKPASAYASTSKIEFTDGDWADKTTLEPMYLKERSGQVTTKQAGTFEQIAKFTISNEGVIGYSGGSIKINTAPNSIATGSRLAQASDLVYGSDAVNSVTGIPSDCLGTIGEQAKAQWNVLWGPYDTDGDGAISALELAAIDPAAVPAAYESSAFYTYYKTTLLVQAPTPDVTVPLKDLSGQTLVWIAAGNYYWKLATKKEYDQATAGDKLAEELSAVPDFNKAIDNLAAAGSGDVDKYKLIYLDLDGTAGFDKTKDMVLGYVKGAQANATDGEGAARPIGEALLVAPATAADGYNIDIKYSRWRREGTKMVWASEVKPLTITNTVDFESGKSHLVTITIYEDALPTVETTDEGWDEGDGYDVGD